MNCTIRVAKTKALISFAVTAKLICAFVFAYADCWFSHEAAQLVILCMTFNSIIRNRRQTGKTNATIKAQISNVINAQLRSVLVFAALKKQNPKVEDSNLLL